MKKFLSALISVLILLSTFVTFAFAAEEEAASLDHDALDTPKSYYEKFKDSKITLNVYNWGEYISTGEDGSLDINSEFEKLTGIKVNYTTYPSNEDLYAKMKSGATNYDIIIPSDYMISRFIDEKMVEKLDFKNIPNYKYIRDDLRNLEFDKNNEYSVPYTWGTVGIIYNKDVVKETVDSWNILWDEKYKGQILMFANPRDAFGIALKKLGYSFNTTNLDEINKAADELVKQKGVVSKYVMDEIFDLMIGGEAALAPYYAGDALTMIEDNKSLDFVVPKEGSNKFIDSICVPTGSKNKEAAEMYINYLTETQVAKANIEYICYSTPHTKAFEELDEETKNNKISYPDATILAKTEVFFNLPDEVNKHVDKLWTDIRMNNEGLNKYILPIIVAVALIFTIIFMIVRAIKKKKNSENGSY